MTYLLKKVIYINMNIIPYIVKRLNLCLFLIYLKILNQNYSP